MSFAYLIALLFSLAGLAEIDRRWRLAAWRDPRTTAICLAVGWLYFTLWDLAGIGLGIFFVGESRFLTGVRLFPEYPLEEAVFLLLLNYNALLAWRAWSVRPWRASSR
jgi:lycopene cyclase domain-containing protein